MELSNNTIKFDLPPEIKVIGEKKKTTNNKWCYSHKCDICECNRLRDTNIFFYSLKKLLFDRV